LKNYLEFPLNSKREALSQIITKADVQELKAIGNPPQIVGMVGDIVNILMG